MTTHEPASAAAGSTGGGDGGRVLVLWVFPLVGLLVGGLLVGVFFQQARQDHAVGYMVSAPANCVLALADRPGGEPVRTVGQYHHYRRVVCDPPPKGSTVYYDPRTDEELLGPDNDRYGMVFGVAVALVFAGPGLLGWIVILRERRVRRRSGGPLGRR